jgi:prophage regulatory protein
MKASNPRRTIVLRRPQVQSQTGLTRSAIYQLMSSGQFPQPIQLTKRSVGWIAHEIDEWIASRVTKSRKPSATSSRGEVSP